VILVDTSVWIEHLRRRHAGLAALLATGDVACHPFVMGEIAIGSLRRRTEVLALLADLPGVALATHDDALAVVVERDLAGRGIGWVDVHLLASALLNRMPLWTLDRRLENAAHSLGVAWSP
jgi:predicted nucleic acid-binding protein